MKPRRAARFADPLAQRDEPERLPLAAYAELHSSHPIADPDALDAIDPLHILAPDYAQERLRWRRKHPLWAAVLRVWTRPGAAGAGGRPGARRVRELGGPARESIGAPRGAGARALRRGLRRGRGRVEAALAAAGVGA